MLRTDGRTDTRPQTQFAGGIINTCHINMNVCVRFDEILSMTSSYVENSVYVYTKATENYKGK